MSSLLPKIVIHKDRFTCRETCQGQEWGLASFPDTILSAMLGLKWAMPQSLGQSEDRKHKNHLEKVTTSWENLKNLLKFVCSCLQVCSRPHPGGAACAVAVVRGSVCMQLRAETPCSTAAAAAEEEAEAEEVQAQPSSSHRITGQHTSHAIYTRQRAHTDVHAQVHIQHTHTPANTSGDNEPCYNKALDCSPVAVMFYCRWEKRGFQGVPSALSHAYSIVRPQYTNMHAGQRKHNTVHKQTSCHVTQSSDTVTSARPQSLISQISTIVHTVSTWLSRNVVVHSFPAAEEL